jgi:hypothetical protein
MSISPVQRDDAARLIRIIREQHGYDDADAHSTPSSAVIGLRGKLERALERLSSDLYNKKTHFLLEFIQNADDNTYADDVTPSLKLRIEDSLVVFECNELGFSADNVKAICDIGASTKTHENSTRGFIGASSPHVSLHYPIYNMRPQARRASVSNPSSPSPTRCTSPLDHIHSTSTAQHSWA